MPRRVNNIFYKSLKFDKMIEAYKRAAKGKKENKEVVLFELDLANNITNLLKEIYNKTYKLSKYREFTVYEPKKRVIWSLPFRDRVMHQWYVEEFIKPIFLPQFIIDSYACIEERGLHQAVEKLQKNMKKMYKQNPDYYIFKCDIAKFFYSISKNKLYKIIERKVKDIDFLEFTKKIIYENTTKEKGIPIRKLYLTIFCQHIHERIRPLHKRKFRNKILYKVYG